MFCYLRPISTRELNFSFLQLERILPQKSQTQLLWIALIEEPHLRMRENLSG